MKKTEYIKWLFLLLAILAITLGVMHSTASFSEYLSFSIFCLICFIIQSTLVYLLGENFSRSSNKNIFSQLIISNNAIKLLLSFIIIVSYVKVVNPTDKLFLLPFLVIYLGFTIFEAFFMMKQAKLKRK